MPRLKCVGRVGAVIRHVVSGGDFSGAHPRHLPRFPDRVPHARGHRSGATRHSLSNISRALHATSEMQVRYRRTETPVTVHLVRLFKFQCAAAVCTPVYSGLILILMMVTLYAPWHIVPYPERANPHNPSLYCWIVSEMQFNHNHTEIVLINPSFRLFI
jgi:hypothetical protein